MYEERETTLIMKLIISKTLMIYQKKNQQNVFKKKIRNKHKHTREK